MPITRFAPSPTGLLHLGHAYAALFAADTAGDGKMLLRMEDIDSGRCRTEFEVAIEADLTWLGLSWPKPVRRQSAHLADYAGAMARLREAGLIYPCFCSRADLIAAAVAPHGSMPVYPGTCRLLSQGERSERLETGAAPAWRLDCAKAVGETGKLTWRDADRGLIKAAPERLGDVVLARKDIATSYHLAVTWDDALQQVEIVTRGEDLFESTHIHRLLQALLGLKVPMWRHHRLLTDRVGKRFAKRDGAVTLQSLRLAGVSPAEVRSRAGFPDKIAP